MGLFIDLTGQVFERLTALSQAGKNKRGESLWLCVCQCGNRAAVTIAHLRSGHTQSCGCLQRQRTSEAAFKDLTGKVFDQLTVVCVDHNKGGVNFWLCRCSCGRFAIVRTASLNNGETRSCGCLVVKMIISRSTFHGATRGGKTPTYNTWVRMRSRCNDKNQPNFADYGGRGIRVCQGWDSFETFLMDMGQKPSGQSIERNENNGDYSCGHCEECKKANQPANCRWATRKEQNRNKRSNHLVTINCVTKTIADWAELVGLDAAVIRVRIHQGWNEVDAVKTPKSHKSKTLALSHRNS